MKTLTRNIIMVAIMLLAMGTSSAVAQNLRDANYNIVGKIAANGTVRNSNYDPIGYFNSDGTIANATSKTVGKLLGEIEVKSGKVTSPDGEVLGYANGISIQRVAAYYFFDFFK